MNKKKGFTLIELLAIIVILAIIAVITVPLILNIINDAQKNASIDSAYGYKSALEKYYMKKVVENTENELPNGYKNISELPEDFIVSGETPSDGWVKLKKGLVDKFSLKYKDYVVTMDNDKNVVSEKKDNIDPRVPDEYQEVEYLESTGTQYIDTEVIPKDNFKMIIDWYTNSVNSAYVAGARKTGSSGGVSYPIVFGQGGSLTGSTVNAYAGGGLTVVNTNGNNWKRTAAGQRYCSLLSTNGDLTYTYMIEDKTNNKKFEAKNVQYDSIASNTEKIYLYALNSMNIIEEMKLYNAKFYENNTIVRNLVPVVRKSDNKSGLLDLSATNLFDKDAEGIINNKYITPSGTTGDSSNHFISDYIDVRGKKNIAISNVTPQTIVYCSFYDSSKELLSSFRYNVIPKIQEVPSDANYVRCTVSKTMSSNFMLNEGTEALPYEPYKKSFYTNDGTGEFITGPEI